MNLPYTEARGTGPDSLKKFLQEHPMFMVLDFSSLSKYEECNRKYQYVYELGLPDQVGIGALFGSELIHPVLSKWYLSTGTWWPDQAWWDKTWSDFIGNIAVPTTTRAEVAYTKENFIKACEKYKQKYTSDFAEYRVVSSEQMYWVVLPGVPGVVWVTKPDLLLERISDAKLVNHDFKSSIWEINEILIPFDRQFVGQSFVTGSDFMRKEHIRLPRTKPKKDAKPDDDGIVIKQTMEPVTKELLDEWLEDVQLKALQLKMSKIHNVWAKSAPKACTDFNGLCQFYDLCNLGKMRHDVIRAKQRRNQWEYLGL